MAILALDLATVTGWALRRDDGELCSGVWGLGPGHGRPYQHRGLNLWWYMTSVHQAWGLTRVVQEAPFIHWRHPKGAMVGIGLMFACQMFCDLKGLGWLSVTPSELKKHAVGKGNAKKDVMLKAAWEQWPGQNVVDHNQGDALWVLDWAENQ